MQKVMAAVCGSVMFASVITAPHAQISSTANAVDAGLPAWAKAGACVSFDGRTFEKILNIDGAWAHMSDAGRVPLPGRERWVNLANTLTVTTAEASRCVD